eukprot:GHRQ01039345.1.p1 GENE.GHRQ01039345.1~~GHRQ01039345.1.p1  ORF type:complete len:139 (-),score=44.68 GHRQ01039345.1:263-679(-)
MPPGAGVHACCCLIPCLRRCSCCYAAGEVNNEYTRQRNYLEKTIDSLKRKLAADSEAHRADELRIMSQNVSLIRELNELRREIKVRDLVSSTNLIVAAALKAGRWRNALAGSTAGCFPRTVIYSRLRSSAVCSSAAAA